MLNAMTDEEYMQLALQEARAAVVIGEIPIGAVLVVEGEVVARAHNMRETWNDATAHAEVIVIREACKKLGRWRLEGRALCYSRALSDVFGRYRQQSYRQGCLRLS